MCDATEPARGGGERHAASGEKLQRVVPRWYYALQIPRVLTPWVFRKLKTKVIDSGVGRKAADFK